MDIILLLLFIGCLFFIGKIVFNLIGGIWEILFGGFL